MKKLYDARFLSNASEAAPVMETLANMEVVEYDDHNGSFINLRYTCVPAQEIAKLAPYGVFPDGVGNMFADPEVLIPFLLKGIQELNERVAALESKPTRRTAAKKDVATE